MVGEIGAGAYGTYGQCALGAAQDWTGWSAVDGSINGGNTKSAAGHDYAAVATRRLDGRWRDGGSGAATTR